MQNNSSSQHSTRFFSKSWSVITLALAVAVGLTLSFSTQAATIIVTSASDEAAPAGGCSLRGAVIAVNSSNNANGCRANGIYGSSDTIQFAPALTGSTIIFSGEIEIWKTLTINGGSANAITLDGNHQTRLFRVRGGEELILSYLALQGGMTYEQGGAISISQLENHVLAIKNTAFHNNHAVSDGGAVFTYGTVTVDESIFSTNRSEFSGGVFKAPAITVNNSIFKNNSADTFGGAIIAGAATINNSVFSGNSAIGSGGAIFTASAAVNGSTFNNNSAYTGGALFALDRIVAAVSTFYSNYAHEGDGQGGAIHTYTDLIANDLTLVNNRAPIGAAIYIGDRNTGSGGIGIIRNSLIVSDVNSQDAHCATESSATLTGGTNLEWRNGSNENSCNSTHPVLVPDSMTLAQIVSTTLTDNGGPTHTLALPVDSPAIDAGDPAAVIGSTDQRGQPRSQGNGPDLGAFETASLSPAPYTHVDTTTRVENGVTLTTINGQLVSYPEHVGMNTATFVFVNITGTDDWLLLNPETGWHPWVDCASSAFPYSFGTMPWVTDIALFYNADLSPFHGWPVLFGYGAGDTKEAACADMFSNTRYTRVTTL